MNKVLIYTSLFTFFALLFTACSTRGHGSYRHYPQKPSYVTQPHANSATPSAKNYKHPTMRPYTVRGVRYYPTVVSVGDTFYGTASWYGPNFHGKYTSNGEIYNMWQMTAAHKTLPMNTIVRVTNKYNGKTAIVRINDRGPFVSTRIIDLSKAAASKIGMIGTGTAPVKLEVLGFQVKGAHTIPTKKQLKHSVQTKHLSSFALQIGSFSNIAGALKTQEKYDNTDGYKTVIKDMQSSGGRMFKVWLTGFKSEQEARDYKAHGIFKHAFIVREK